MSKNYSYIDTPDALKQACSELAKASVLCVDTEFHREKTYFAHFALLQISSRESCYVIDPTAINDLSPVWELMHNKDILKVFHAARQDLEIIMLESGGLPEPLFDTQVAAALLGYGQQIGFGNLVQRILKKALPKGESFSDWLSRPLTPKQLTYAADDVIYLMPIYQHLEEQLQARGRREWLLEEQETLSSEKTYLIDRQEVYWRVKGVNRLRPRQLAILRELAAWREHHAEHKNIPRRRIVADDPLIDLAKKDSVDLSTMGRMRGLSDGVIKRFGNEIIAVWEKGVACPEEDWPKLHPRSFHTSGTDLRQELLDTLVRLKAEEESIASNILVNQRELGALASWGKQRKDEPPELSVLHGWRRELVGNDLLRLLNGEISLRINPESALPEIEEIS
ncbi:MAG: ribonuclease D [Mariprofundaceae bacterium]|nr:ribonuclease D [Mariprofundaceae bacterium]